METVALSDECVQDILEILFNAGLIWTPEKAAKFNNTFYEGRKAILQKEAVTRHQIIKYDLLNGVTSKQTVKNRVHSTKNFRENEDYYYNSKGHLMIMVASLEKLMKV